MGRLTGQAPGASYGGSKPWQVLSRCTPIAPIPAAPSAPTDAGSPARISGWVHRKRDHGGLLFIDLRDHYGLTQCVIAQGSPVFEQADRLRPESVITVTGDVVRREGATINPRLPTGEIELQVRELVVQSEAAGAAHPGGRRAGIPRRPAAALPLP